MDSLKKPSDMTDAEYWQYVERLLYIEKYMPVMTRKEQDEMREGRTDWPEETLIKWSGKLAERNARIDEIRRRAYAKQSALSGSSAGEQCKNTCKSTKDHHKAN